MRDGVCEQPIGSDVHLLSTWHFGIEEEFAVAGGGEGCVGAGRAGGDVGGA